MDMSKFCSVRQRRSAATGLRAAAILAAAALTGCATYHAAVAVDDYPEDVRLRHPISIREGFGKLELFVGVNRGALTPAQQVDVVAFAHTWRGESSGGVLIDIPSGTPNAHAAHEAANEVRAILAAAGVSPSVIATRQYRPVTPMKFATLRLSYPKMIAESGPCGMFPKDLGPSLQGIDPTNHSYWNFGCSQQHNLAALVENPADLVQPRGESPAYAARRSVMLDKYRKGEPTATRNPDADKGKISDIAK
jgi:pilus assembly protein CpaD